MIIVISDIYDMSLDQLKAAWAEDSNHLTTTVIAEATGNARPYVSQFFRSEAYHRTWSEALIHARDNLASSYERQRYEESPKLHATNRLLKAVRTAHDEAAIVRKTYRDRIAKSDPERLRMNRSEEIALSWLRRAHADEATAFRMLICQMRGIPTYDENSTKNGNYEDVYEMIEDSNRKGIYGPPATDLVHWYLDMDDEIFTDKVSLDVRNSDEKVAEFRHPLLLNDWCASLQDLSEQCAEQARMDPETGVSLHGFKIEDLWDLDTDEEAYAVLRSRRFFRAVQQRLRECAQEVSDATLAIGRREIELNEPWADVEDELRKMLAKKYPDQHQAILKMLVPFELVPGLVDEEKLPLTGSGKRRGELKQMALAAIEDGSYRNLL